MEGNFDNFEDIHTCGLYPCVMLARASVVLLWIYFPCCMKGSPPSAGDGSRKLSPVFAKKAPTSHHKIATIIRYIHSEMLPYNIYYKKMMRIVRLHLMTIRIEGVHYQIGICNEHKSCSEWLIIYIMLRCISLENIWLKINVKTLGKNIRNNAESILRLTLTEHQANMHMQMCIRSIIASTMWVIFYK